MRDGRAMMRGWTVFALASATSAVACNFALDASDFQVVPGGASDASRDVARTTDGTVHRRGDSAAGDARRDGGRDAQRDRGVADAGKDGGDAHTDATKGDALTDAPSPDGSTDTGAADAPRDVAHDAPHVCLPDASFESDPANCGRCGHDCFDAGCASGVCASKPVSFGTGTPTFLTVVAGVVYWTQQSTASSPDALMTATAGGGNAVTLRVLPNNPEGILADSQRLYWGITGNNNNNAPYGVFACPLAGCTDAGPVLLAPAVNYDTNDNLHWDSVSGFAVASGTIYETLQGGYLRECPVTEVDGGCKQVATGLYNPASPQADDAGVVWANTGGSYQYSSGSIQTCAPSGNCPTPTYVDNSIQPQYLAMDAVRVFWTELTGYENNHWVGNVMGCLRDSCEESVVTLATNQANPQGIVFDATQVYWADMAGASVMTCPLGGCPDGGPTVLSALDGGVPFQIALDRTTVYWSNYVQGGAIMRVAKP